MNSTINQLLTRKSMRVFTDENIRPEEKEAILLSAINAPTAGNQQLYTILDIQDAGKKLRLSELCDHQPFIASAPMVLIFVADQQKWYDAYSTAGCHPREVGMGDMMLAVTDSCIAAQNAVTAAESLGIGSCYIGDVMEQYEAMRELLSLPEYTFPCAMLVFGYPTEQQKKRSKPERFLLNDIVCVDTYEKKDETELRDMFAKRAGEQGFDAYMQAFCARKYNSDFSREMTRSVNKYCENWDRSRLTHEESI